MTQRATAGVGTRVNVTHLGYGDMGEGEVVETHPELGHLSVLWDVSGRQACRLRLTDAGDALK